MLYLLFLWARINAAPSPSPDLSLSKNFLEALCPCSVANHFYSCLRICIHIEGRCFKVCECGSFRVNSEHLNGKCKKLPWSQTKDAFSLSISSSHPSETSSQIVPVALLRADMSDSLLGYLKRFVIMVFLPFSTKFLPPELKARLTREWAVASGNRRGIRAPLLTQGFWKPCWACRVKCHSCHFQHFTALPGKEVREWIHIHFQISFHPKKHV